MTAYYWRHERRNLENIYAEVMRKQKHALNNHAETMRKCFVALCNTSRKMGLRIFCDRSPTGGKKAPTQTPEGPGGPARPGWPACPVGVETMPPHSFSW